ncbi:MAG: TonB-dependent receptor, partial [Gemmatimonadetes bacterium]|nr:TonB-dependent receptor [Gemmatimonadota bacterium]
TGNLSDRLAGSFTVGQNLNHQEFSRNLLSTSNLFPGTQQADFGVDRVPNEYEYTTRTDGYFGTGEMTFADQLTVTGTGRVDGSSTFGGDGKRFFYPSVGASWAFTKLGAFDNVNWFDFGKLRASWGRVGRQPPVYSNTSGFTTGTIGDGYINGINTVYAGQTGVFAETQRGNPDIAPEVKTEREVGADLAFFGRRMSLGVTYYDNTTSDVILAVPTATSRGLLTEFKNVAEFDANGWELSLDLLPVQTRGFTWTVNTNYTTTETCVTELAGAENVYLNGFTGSTVSLVGPNAAGTRGCNPFGVFFGGDFVRFGRGTLVDGVDIDATYGGAAGALYIAEDGFPIQDDQSRVVGDPNPDWTASIRNTFQIGSNLRLSALLDIRRGGDVWNGTKGALLYFGTHEESLPFHGEGSRRVFGQFALPNGQTPAVAGPGAGSEVTLNSLTWMLGGLGSGFTGPVSQFIEDGSFVKLRDVSVSYTLQQMAFMERLGIGSADITLSGRNLKTWTDYTGIDPESNLTGQSLGRGLDYFNNPQTRSFVISVNLNR